MEIAGASLPVVGALGPIVSSRVIISPVTQSSSNAMLTDWMAIDDLINDEPYTVSVRLQDMAQIFGPPAVSERFTPRGSISIRAPPSYLTAIGRGNGGLHLGGGSGAMGSTAVGSGAVASGRRAPELRGLGSHEDSELEFSTGTQSQFSRT
jgi:hypothetical protein